MNRPRQLASTHGADDAVLKRAECDAMRADGTHFLASGSLIGIASVASTLLLGATCPLCLVGVPALIGYGVIQRVRAERLHRDLCRAELDPSSEGALTAVDPLVQPPDDEPPVAV